MKLEIVDMPEWKAKVLRVVAWCIGIRGEEPFVMTLSDGEMVDKLKKARKRRNK